MHYSHSDIVLIVADIAYWPATPRMKSLQPTTAKRLNNPGVYWEVCTYQKCTVRCILYGNFGKYDVLVWQEMNGIMLFWVWFVHCQNTKLIDGLQRDGAMPTWDSYATVTRSTWHWHVPEWGSSLSVIRTSWFFSAVHGTYLIAGVCDVHGLIKLLNRLEVCCVSKNHTGLARYNFDIWMTIFGQNVAERLCCQMMICFPTLSADGPWTLIRTWTPAQTRILARILACTPTRTRSNSDPNLDSDAWRFLCNSRVSCLCIVMVLISYWSWWCWRAGINAATPHS